MPVVLLVDNGSKKPDATLQLRHVAQQLSVESGQEIHAVSLQHSDQIDAGDLNGIPANTFYDFLDGQLLAGEREFVVLPLFFGASRALTAFIPEQLELLRQRYGEFELRLAEVPYPLPESDSRLVDVLYEHTIKTAKQYQLPLRNVVLLDHGSPLPQVTEVRQNLASHLQEKLGEGIVVDQAVMERREGADYDFNGPLLRDWLIEKAQQGETSAIVIMLFFLPGRHAGEGGDIEHICESVMRKYAGFQIAMSPLISEHPLLLSILHARITEAQT